MMTSERLAEIRRTLKGTLHGEISAELLAEVDRLRWADERRMKLSLNDVIKALWGGFVTDPGLCWDNCREPVTHLTVKLANGVTITFAERATAEPEG